MGRGRLRRGRSQTSPSHIPSSCRPSCARCCSGGERACMHGTAMRSAAWAADSQASHAPPTQVAGHLYSKSWETRVAAGDAIGHLAEAFMHHSVQDLVASVGRQAAGSASSSHQVNLTFSAFNLKQVLEKGSALLASGGQVRAALSRTLNALGLQQTPMCPALSPSFLPFSPAATAAACPATGVRCDRGPQPDPETAAGEAEAAAEEATRSVPHPPPPPPPMAPKPTPAV